MTKPYLNRKKPFQYLKKKLNNIEKTFSVLKKKIEKHSKNLFNKKMSK
jgi:hypothetical protein